MKENNDGLCNVTKSWLTGLLSYAEKAEAVLSPLDNLSNKELIQRVELVTLFGYIQSARNILELHDESK